ncbi:MAG: DUF3052 family protein [Candidatus Korobacteraceae bacterium]
MGSEQLCTVRTGGKTSKGKALLETSEIIFRGDFRLKIPFASIESTVAKDGELRLKWADGSAVFELGERAAKWADKILHPKSTAEKLGIKPGLTVSVCAIRDPDFMRDLRASTKAFSNTKLLQDSDLIFMGASETEDLGEISDILPALAASGALWIVYPKGKQEIKEVEVIEAGRSAGLVDVKVVKFSATHTALKFVRPKAKR